MQNLIGDAINEIVDEIVTDYDKNRAIDKLDVYRQPSSATMVDIIHKLFRIVYPGYYIDRTYRTFNIRTTTATVAEDTAYRLSKQIALALRFDDTLQHKTEEELKEVAQRITVQFMKALPRIREYLDTDIQALYEGDPAAKSTDEIIISYPGLYAISIYRFAHELYLMNVPVIPRIMTEHAHGETGIDINPGATIGKYFFIDHGTGIVVGETTVIGDHVKLYQGVTLGALSLKGGRSLLDVRRHPTIQNNVTIYSNASILGGETVIGEGSIVGGNVFLTRSIPAGTKVYAKSQELHFDSDSDIPTETRDVTQSDNTWFYVI
ncbi:MAG: serine acetyltransferase [Clostridia bacterium]|nr:serine acetyltransferase [Clostridia bacterium]